MRPNAHHAATLAAAVLVTLMAFGVGAARGAAPVPYTDPAGDNASAPDIQAVTLTDNGNGTVHVQVDLAATIPDDGDSAVAMWIDADRNPQTGSQSGNEVGIIADSHGIGVVGWSSEEGDWESRPSYASMTPTLDGGRLAFTLTLADFQLTTGFNFYLGGYHGDDIDWAPDEGAYTFEVGAATAVDLAAPALPAAPTITGVMVSMTALAPKAGKKFTVPAPRLRLSDDELVAPDGYTCTLSNHGKVIQPLRKCTWKLPKTAKGKTLTLKLVVSYQGASKTFRLPVLPG